MAETMMPVWRVGAIMNEPLAEVLKFCAWYLAQGADELVICFDDPQDPALEVLSPHPRIRCIPCTPAFWAQLGLSPSETFVTRQNTALTWVYRQYADGWLLNVDADEFLFVDGGSVASVLAAVPSGKISVRVRTAERVLVKGVDAPLHFRLPMGRAVRRAVYGEDAPLFGPRREGLVGHSHGKSLVRCGINGLALRQHWPRGLRPGGADEVVLRPEHDAYLLHMIGADYDVWRQKLDWRSGSRGFTDGLTERVASALACSAPDEALRDLHSRIHCSTSDRLKRMEAHGVLLTLNMNIDAAMQQHFGVSLADLGALGASR